MAKTLQQVIGAENLVGVIQGIKPGLPPVLPEAMLRPTDRVNGNIGTYMKVEGTRKTARLVYYGGPSVARKLKGVTEVGVVLIHSLENHTHKPTTLMNLKSVGSEVRQKMGRDEVARQTGDFKQLYVNLRQSAAISALAKGSIWFDSEGNLLPSASSAAVTVAFQIPAGNQNQLDVFGSGAIIGAKWSAAGTGIHTHIKNLKVASVKKTGYRITEAFYGGNVLDYFLTNTKLKEIINRNQRQQEAFLNNEIADGFLGLNWHPIYEQFYVDDSGTIQTMVGDNLVVFTPPPSPDWWGMIEGSYPVPTNIGVVADDAVGILDSSMLETFGMFSYAYQTPDPSTIKQLAGDTMLPVIKVPGAVFQATVHW